MEKLIRSMLLVMAAVVIVGCSQLPVSGQDNNGKSKSIVGVWRTAVTPRICATGAPVGPTFPGILLFENGGTMTGTSTAASSVYGVWDREPGPRQYSFATISLRYDPSGNLIGYRRITQTVSIDESGTAFTSSGEFQDTDINGVLVMSGCATSVGTRFE